MLLHRKKLFLVFIFIPSFLIARPGKPVSHAYLSIPTLRALIDQSELATACMQYRPIIDECLANEKQHFQDYHVFYHACSGSFRVYQDLVKELYRLEHPGSCIRDFEFLRSWFQMRQTYDANQFIDEIEQKRIEKHPDELPPVWNDNRSSLRRQMLSVNLSLFGNTKNVGVKGESSLRYFVNGNSIKPPEIWDWDGLVDELLIEFGLNRMYCHYFRQLSDNYQTTEGLLYQIFIPCHLVDHYVFAAMRQGSPERLVIEENYYYVCLQRHTCITPILHRYEQMPESMVYEVARAPYLGTTSPLIDTLQARILLSQDCMLNPTSGVKILRYTSLPAQDQIAYQKEFKALLKKMLKEKLDEPNYGYHRYDKVMKQKIKTYLAQ